MARDIQILSFNLYNVLSRDHDEANKPFLSYRMGISIRTRWLYIHDQAYLLETPLYEPI